MAEYVEAIRQMLWGNQCAVCGPPRDRVHPQVTRLCHTRAACAVSAGVDHGETHPRVLRRSVDPCRSAGRERLDAVSRKYKVQDAAADGFHLATQTQDCCPRVAPHVGEDLTVLERDQGGLCPRVKEERVTPQAAVSGVLRIIHRDTRGAASCGGHLHQVQEGVSHLVACP